MTLEELRIECGWSRNEMARRADVDFSTVKKAINGETVSISTAHKLAAAISHQLDRTIQFQQIKGLNVRV